MKSPTAAEVEQLAIEHQELTNKIDGIFAAAKLEAKEPGERLTKLVTDLKTLTDQFGTEYEKKSKLLNGLEWELMLTASSSTSVDEAAVIRFEEWAKGDRERREIAKLLFVTVTRHDLSPNATVLIQAPGIPAHAKKLFAECLKITPNAPRLTVRPKKGSKAAEAAKQKKAQQSG